MRRRLVWLEVGAVESGHCWLVLEFFGPIFYQNPATLQRPPGTRTSRQLLKG